MRRLILASSLLSAAMAVSTCKGGGDECTGNGSVPECAPAGCLCQITNVRGFFIPVRSCLGIASDETSGTCTFDCERKTACYANGARVVEDPPGTFTVYGADGHACMTKVVTPANDGEDAAYSVPIGPGAEQTMHVIRHGQQLDIEYMRSASGIEQRPDMCTNGDDLVDTCDPVWASAPRGLGGCCTLGSCP